MKGRNKRRDKRLTTLSGGNLASNEQNRRKSNPVMLRVPLYSCPAAVLLSCPTSLTVANEGDL